MPQCCVWRGGESPGSLLGGSVAGVHSMGGANFSRPRQLDPSSEKLDIDDVHVPAFEFDSVAQDKWAGIRPSQLAPTTGC